MRDRVIRIVLAWAKQQGYERMTGTRNADRVIRIGGRQPWLTIEDDGYEVEAIGKAIASVLRTPIVEAYCEASARVGLGVRLGRSVGGWGWGYGKPPAARTVESILVDGSVTELEQAWQDGARQVFPETALAAAAKRLGIDVGVMFRDRLVRGTTLALRRRRPAWTPVYRTGAPAFEVGWGSNQGWGYKHLVFEEQVEHHRVHVTSVGGPGTGIAIRFAGSAVDDGHIEIVSASHEDLALVRDGTTWRDAAAAVPAGLVDPPDTFGMPRATRHKLDKITDRLEWYIDVEYRARKEGECVLRTIVESQGHASEGELELMVLWRPWRPSTTRTHVDDHQLFQLHRCEHSALHLALKGSLADAWAWAQPHLAAWTADHGERFLNVMQDGVVVLDERREGEVPLAWDRVPALFTDARTPFVARGLTYRFGTTSFAPWRMDPRESLAVQLVLWAQNADEDGRENLAKLAAIADDAIARGVAYSAHLGEQQYVPDEQTTWEQITATDDAPLKLVAWQQAHIRGLNKRIWMSADHAARIDRRALAEHATVTDLGRGIRIAIDPERPRRDMEPLVAILGPLLPSAQTIEAFKTARAAELALSAPPAMAAERVIDERA